MRTIFQNKSVKLNELSDDQIAVVNAERTRNRAVERQDRTADQIRRLKEDAELFGKPTTADEIRTLEHQLEEDRELVARCERELADAKAEPERRAAREKRGAEVKRNMTILDHRISAAMESIAPLMLEADSLIQTVIDEFTRNRCGWNMFDTPFTDDASRTLLERLRFFARNIGVNGDTETFADRLAHYRKIGEPTKPVDPPKSAGRLGTYQRSKPLPRQARENAAVRLRLSPTGVVNETSR